jgi:hypothetical protein
MDLADAILQLAGGIERVAAPLEVIADFLTDHGDRLLGAADASGHLAAVAQNLTRIADAAAPAKDPVVGTAYVAGKLGCTVTWVSELVRLGRIPRHCVVAGTGDGKPWKFHRHHVDAWLASR